MMIRPVQSIAGIAILFVAPAFAGIQQKTDSQTRQGQPPSSSSSAIQRSYAAGAGTPARVVQTRTESNGREVITETTEVPNLDGKLKMSLETTTETIRTGADSTQIKHEVFTSDPQGRRLLLESTQTDVQTLADGGARSVANTFAPDLNGRLGLSAREVTETRSTAPDVKQTDTTIYRPGLDGLRESERMQETERKVGSDVTQNESTRFVVDGNGKWQAAEMRSKEVRVAGKEQVTEETVRRPGAGGALALSEKSVTRQSKSDGQEETVIETYSHDIVGLAASGSTLPLSQRTRVTTSTSADGGQQTIREVEARNPGSPNDPLRVVERTVETLRQVGPDRWEVQRQVFALDANGRLSPVMTDKGEAVGK